MTTEGARGAVGSARSGAARAQRAPSQARRTRRFGPFAVAAGSLALFAAMLVLLADRVAAGSDPVLGPPVAAPAPRKVLVRRVRKRVIVETTLPASGRAPATSVSSGPVVAAAAPAAEAPAPVTRSS